MTTTRPPARTRPGSRRELLLAEIVRRRRECDAQARVGLTKEEARVYHGFERARREAWNEDELWERDTPEWWQDKSRES